MTTKSAIIVAAGLGSRFSGDTPKQYSLLQGKPVLQWVIDAFTAAITDIELIIVLHPSLTGNEHKYLDTTVFKNVKIAFGGETRFHSVRNGLAKATGDYVAIHDAARPLVSQALILESFEVAKKYGAAIPVTKPIESLRKIDGHTSRAVDRNRFVNVQTPQCFKTILLKQAYTQEYARTFTDCASVYERTGNSVYLFNGDYYNIKITTAKDMVVAETLINARLQQRKNRLS